ncbi:hypothetical protein [Corynebacterium mastitidis]|uniref:hypothetical protein n=1 Tax=Corynebacterium mastitidis TaxID=161890 RepID=UPI00037631CF|nr:hypothetical protein [Corynebacterium mastitidis]
MKKRILALAPLLPLALAACTSAEENPTGTADNASAATTDPTVVNAERVRSDRAAGPAIEINLEGTFKPNAKLTVSTPCTPEDQSALAVASFGESATLERGTDDSPLTGTLTAPNNIGPGPNDGPHTITVTCDGGANSTIDIPSAGNGDAKDAGEEIPAP